MIGFSKNNWQFLLLFSILIFSKSTNAEAPEISGIYDLAPNFKILNYRGPNVIKCNLSQVDKPEDYVLNWYQGDKKIEPKEDDLYFNIKDNDLIIKNVNDEIFRETYHCDLVQKEDDIIVSSADFKLLGKVMAKIVFQGVFLEGRKVILECQVLGYPQPHIEWRYENTTFASSFGRYIVKDNILKGLGNSFLEIEEAELSDRGEYGCKATNDRMSQEDIVYVRVKGKYSALWPFFGICIEVTLLCVIIYYYERRRADDDDDDFYESDIDQSPEPKTTSDHGKDTVRQRSNK